MFEVVKQFVLRNKVWFIMFGVAAASVGGTLVLSRWLEQQPIQVLRAQLKDVKKAAKHAKKAAKAREKLKVSMEKEAAKQAAAQQVAA